MTPIQAAVQQYERTILELQARLGNAASEIAQFQDKIAGLEKSFSDEMAKKGLAKGEKSKGK